MPPGRPISPGRFPPRVGRSPPPGRFRLPGRVVGRSGSPGRLPPTEGRSPPGRPGRFGRVLGPSGRPPPSEGRSPPPSDGRSPPPIEGRLGRVVGASGPVGRVRDPLPNSGRPLPPGRLAPPGRLTPLGGNFVEPDGRFTAEGRDMPSEGVEPPKPAEGLLGRVDGRCTLERLGGREPPPEGFDIPGAGREFPPPGRAPPPDGRVAPGAGRDMLAPPARLPPPRLPAPLGPRAPPPCISPLPQEMFSGRQINENNRLPARMPPRNFIVIESVSLNYGCGARFGWGATGRGAGVG